MPSPCCCQALARTWQLGEKLRFTVVQIWEYRGQPSVLVGPVKPELMPLVRSQHELKGITLLGADLDTTLKHALLIVRLHWFKRNLFHIGNPSLYVSVGNHAPHLLIR
jgi:hypothetical protein